MHPRARGRPRWLGSGLTLPAPSQEKKNRIGSPFFSHHPNNSDARSQFDWYLLQFKTREQARAVEVSGKKARENPMRSQTNRVHSSQAQRGRHSASSASISQNHLDSPRVLEIYGLHMAQTERPASCSHPDAVAKRKGRDGTVTLS